MTREEETKLAKEMAEEFGLLPAPGQAPDGGQDADAPASDDGQDGEA